MPGTPDPVLGSDALTFAAAVALGALAASAPFLLRRRFGSPGRFAATAGFAYGTLYVSLWAGARLVADAFDAPGVAPFALASLALLAAQAGVPYYLAARFRLYGPLLGLFATSVLVGYAFLRVRGESDPVGLYVLFAPVVLAGCSLLGLAELGGRRALRAVRAP